jgi:hypothetical protein
VNDPTIQFVRDDTGDVGIARRDTATFGANMTMRIRDVRDKMDAYLRDVVVERMANLSADKMMASELERRIEVAVKAAMPGIESQVRKAVEDAVRIRVADAMAKVPIAVSFAGSVEAKP